MSKITYPNKNIGDQFRATEANEIKASVNALYDDVTEINEDILELTNDITESKPYLTNFSYQVSSISETDNNYTAWPYGCLFYDGSIDRVIQVYSAKNNHVGTTGVIYIRKLDYKNSLDWGGRVVVADRTGESLVATTHAAGMAANGDYLCIVRFTNTSGTIISTYLYKSTNQGDTWTGSQWLENGVSPLNPAEAGSIFKTETGTLLTYYRSIEGASFITKSTDNGTTWSNKPVSNPFGDTPLEGGFVQVPDGTIVCVVRATVGGPDYPSKVAAIFTQSTDDGETWSPLALTNISDMTSNPAALMYHSETNTIEIVYGSRFAQSDGYSSLWQSYTSIENLKLGIFNAPVRIALGSGTRDFGYSAMVKTPDGHVIVGYYNGLSTKTSLNYLVGRRGQATEGVSTNPYSLLRNPASNEPHVDFSTAIDTGTNRSMMGIKNLSYANFSIVPTTSSSISSYSILTLNNTTRNVEKVANSAFLHNNNSVAQASSGFWVTNPSIVQSTLDVYGGGSYFLNGSDSGSPNSRTNSTNKVGRIAAPHYLTAEEPTGIVFTNNTSTTNVLNFGGGSGLLNAATDINFYTAVNNATVTGTVRMSIDSAGTVNVVGSLKAGQLNVNALNTAPASATATGTLGEIRITATHIYVCMATNTWVRAALATW